MDKKNDMAPQKQYIDKHVIDRGCAIYDEWQVKRFSSKAVVLYVEDAVRTMNKSKATSAYTDALACLFALDIRIKKKYKRFLQCVFSCFSWRREARAFKFLTISLNLPGINEESRSEIDLKLQQLLEKIEAKEIADSEDEAHGGKRNGKTEEKTTFDKEKTQDGTASDTIEESFDVKDRLESLEEKGDEPSIEKSSEHLEENALRQTSEETTRENNKTTLAENKERAKEENQEIKEENNGTGEISEPSTDKKEGAKAYNDAVDTPPLYEERPSDKSTTKTSLIDEVIMDNMVKGNEDFIWHNPVDDVKQSTEADRTQNISSTQAMENESSNKDAYLYDKMLATDKGGTQQTEKIESTQQTEKTPEVKSEEQKAFVQKNDTFEPVQMEAENFRAPIQVDISHTQENEMRMELSSNMSSEAIEAIKEAQSTFMSEQLDILDAEHKANANAMREQLKIASEDFGMNDTDKTARVSEPNAVSSPSVTQNRK